MLGLQRTRVEGPCRDAHAQKQSFFIQGHGARGQILSVEFHCQKFNVLQPLIPKNMKSLSVLAEAKYLGSSMPKSNKERA